MELIKLIVYLSLGTVIGWFANRMVKGDHRQINIPVLGKAEKS